MTTNQPEMLPAGAVFDGDWVTFGSVTSPAEVLHVDRESRSYRVTLRTEQGEKSVRLPAEVELHRNLYANPPF